MHHKRVSGFTLVELVIVIAVIAILAVLSLVGYGSIRAAAMAAAAKSDLQNVSTVMQLALQETGTYPATLPPSVKASPNVQLEVKWSGTITSYGTLTAVQNGVLMSQICQTLINEGLGRGTNQGGQIQNYITGCGNWNHGSMQVTAWDSRVWNTPVSEAQLTNYANNFTSGDTWNASQVPTVKNFYTQLVQRHKALGGTFPITSFWDSWATPQNGGVMTQALPSSPTTRISYCVEATTQGTGNTIWHIGEDGILREGICS